MKALEALSNFISKYMAAFVIIVAAVALYCRGHSHGRRAMLHICWVSLCSVWE